MLCKSPGVGHTFWCKSPGVPGGIVTVQIDTCIILVKLVHSENENARLENFCQVMFSCRHFYCVWVEPHCKHRPVEFLTTQTDQSKRDILIDYVPIIFTNVGLVLTVCLRAKQIVHFRNDTKQKMFELLCAFLRFLFVSYT